MQLRKLLVYSFIISLIDSLFASKQPAND